MRITEFVVATGFITIVINVVLVVLFHIYFLPKAKPRLPNAKNPDAEIQGLSQ